MHANVAVLGGFALCGDPHGDTTDDTTRVTCPKCLEVIRRYQATIADARATAIAREEA